VERCRAGAAAAATRLSALWPAGAEAPADQGGLAALPVCAPQAFTEWGGCRGSSPNTRGYTCGLWQLLHALAAQLPDAPGAGAAWLAAVAGWGKHFFQCSECSAHFTAHATATAATAVASKREAVLWVWRTHNLVNERLVGEDADSGGGDPEFPHVQWPTPAECAQCRRAKGDWDEDAVYGFLQRYYGVVGEAGAARLKAASRRGGWGDAALVCAAVAAAVYGVLRNSGQYALRKSGSRLL
jgi:thiol oxidase